MKVSVRFSEPVAATSEWSLQWLLRLTVEAETPSELKDCETWSSPHRRHVRAIHVEHWPADISIQKWDALPDELYDKTHEVMLLFDRPFSWNVMEAGENCYGFRIEIERTPVVEAVYERLQRADHIDAVTLAIEALLLEAETQKLSYTSRRRSESHGNCMT